MPCMTRIAVNVRPKAPFCGAEPILASETGVMSESLGREERLAVRSGKRFVWKGKDAVDDVGEEILMTGPP